MGTLLTVGELTLDSVVVEGEKVDWFQRGGGALYSAVGARLWTEQVAICASVGPDYRDEWLEELTSHGLDTRAIARVDGNSLGLWLLYERGGRRHQLVKASASTFAELDRARLDWREMHADVVGVHVAPQTPAAQRQELARARSVDAVATQDLLIEPFIDVDAYRSGEALQGADVFLPSRQEVTQVWGESMDAAMLRRTVSELAGVDSVVLKRGAFGVDVVTPAVRTSVPTAVRDVVDPTGAGDAFCGGFLAGLVATGDVVEAAVRATVSAALVVETRDAIEALETLDRFDRDQRAGSVRAALPEDLT